MFQMKTSKMMIMKIDFHKKEAIFLKLKKQSCPCKEKGVSDRSSERMDWKHFVHYLAHSAVLKKSQFLPFSSF